jgi:beta-galactosidase
LKPGTARAIEGLPGNGRDVAALAHLEGATAIATFAEDFYAGRPAVTVNQCGHGRAYFLGTRLDAGASDALYGRIIQANSITRVLPSPLPLGVTAQIRGAESEAFIFLLNFTTSRQTIDLGEVRLRNVETDKVHTHSLDLAPLAAEVYRPA